MRFRPDFHSFSHALIAMIAIAALGFRSPTNPEPLYLNSGVTNRTLISSYASLFTEADSITLPIKRAGRLLMVEANIDGEAGNFIFDTGATSVVLNKTYFREHVVNDNLKSNGITGDVDKVEGITIDRITISDLSFKRVTANLANLGHIENRRGIKILGLFGFNLLRNFEIVIDINNGNMHLYKIDKKGNRLRTGPVFKPDYIQKFEVSHNVVFVKGMIAGKDLRFCFDTGAETNVISTSAPKTVLQTVSITRKSSLQGAGSTSNQVLFGTMNDFIFGSTQLAPMETIISSMDNLNDAYEVHIDGMLGFNFLTKGIICINFEKNLFGISFNKAAGQ